MLVGRYEYELRLDYDITHIFLGKALLYLLLEAIYEFEFKLWSNCSYLVGELLLVGN